MAGRPDRGGLSVARHALDQLVAHIVVECLTDTTSVPEVSEAGIGTAMGCIVEARTRLEDLARDYGSRLSSRAEYHAARTAAQNSVHDAELALGKANRTFGPQRAPIGDGGALQHAWHEVWTIPQKRAVLAALVDTLVVHPDPNAVPQFRPERVELTLRA
ncbi:hypothetical protein CCO04_12585 [Pimelobacter sp. 30-1]|nr:hypothetical protein [Pimelobacter sp. 30-1]